MISHTFRSDYSNKAFRPPVPASWRSWPHSTSLPPDIHRRDTQILPLLSACISALTAFKADIFPYHFHNLHRLLFAFLRHSVADISSLPQRIIMVRSLIRAAGLWLWKLRHIDYLRFLYAQEPIQFPVDIIMELFFISFLPAPVLFPSRIILFIVHIASCLLPKPVCI